MSRLRRGVCILFVLMFAVPLPASSSTPVPVEVTPSGTIAFPEGGGTRVLNLTVPADGLVKGTTLSVIGSPIYTNQTWSATAEDLWAGADSKQNLTLGPDGIGLGEYGSWWEEESPELGFSEGVDAVSIRSPILNVSAYSRVIVEGFFPGDSSYSVDVLDPTAGDTVLAGGLKNGIELPASIWSMREAPYRDLVMRLNASRAHPSSTPTVFKWGVGTGWRAGPEATSWSGDAVTMGGWVELGQKATWTEMSPPSSPPCRAGLTLVYSPLDGTVLMWGGESDADTYPTAMWSYSPASAAWTDITPPTVPPGRRDHAMAYDTLRNRVYMLAGADASGCRDDMWAFTPASNAWTQLLPPDFPPARWAHSMAYVPGQDVVVLFGGWEGGTQACLGDTWLYHPATDSWERRAPAASPPARASASLVYDEDAGAVFLFGGTDGTTCYDDLWAYDAREDTWAPRRPATRPHARADACMVYDTALDESVLFSGAAGPAGPIFSDTWAYNYSRDEWTDLTTFPGLPVRRGAGMAYVPDLGLLVMIGGTDGGGPPLSDTWTLRVQHATISHVLTPLLSPLAGIYGNLRVGASLPEGTGCWVDVTDGSGTVLCAHLMDGDQIPVEADEHPTIRLDLVLFTSIPSVTPVVWEWGFGTEITLWSGVALPPRNTDFLNWTKEQGVRLDSDVEGEDIAPEGGFDIVRLSNGTYRMYYTGCYQSTNLQSILSALSEDGLVWRKEDGVRVAGMGAGYDDRDATDPYVLALSNGTYRMFYSCTNSWEFIPAYTSSAFSVDGINWTKEGVRLNPGGRADGYDDWRASGSFWVVSVPGGYRMLYTGLDDSLGRHRILSAFSPDSLTWTKEPGVRVNLGAAEDFEGNTVEDPVLMRLENGTYRMFYTCSNEYASDNAPRIRSAISADLLDWSKEDGIRIDVGTGLDGDPALTGGRVLPYMGGYRLYYLGRTTGDRRQILSAASVYDYSPLMTSIIQAPRCDRLSSFHLEWEEDVPASTSISVSISTSAEDLDRLWRPLMPGEGLRISDLGVGGSPLHFNVTQSTSNPNVIPAISDLRLIYEPYFLDASIVTGPLISTADGEIVSARTSLDGMVPNSTALVSSFSVGGGAGWQDSTPGAWTDFISPGGSLESKVRFDGIGNGTATLKNLRIDYVLQHQATDLTVDVGGDGSVEWRHDGALGVAGGPMDLTEAVDAFVTAHRAEAKEGVLNVPLAMTSRTAGTVTIGDPRIEFAFSPNVISISPLGTDVPLDAPMEICFDMPIKPGSLTLTITPPLSYELDWTLGQTRLTIAHARLDENVTYTVTLGLGTSSVEDAPLLEARSWNFTTIEVKEGAPSREPVRPDAVPVAVLASGSIIVLLGVFASTEYGGCSVMGLLIPLYARLKREAVLDNKTRFALHGIILENPGIHFKALVKQLDIPTGSAIYHLGVLEREGFIKTRRDGVLKRFYIDAAKVPQGNEPSPEDLRLRIVMLVCKEPGLTQTAISERMGKERDMVGYHLRALVRGGYLTGSRAGKYTVYHPAGIKKDRNP